MESLWWTVVVLGTDRSEEPIIYRCWDEPTDIQRLREGLDVEWLCFTTADHENVMIRAETVATIEVSRQLAVDLELDSDEEEPPPRGRFGRIRPRGDKQKARSGR